MIATLTTEHRVKARKHHTCNYCTCAIEPDDGYTDTVYAFGATDFKEVDND